MVRGIGTAPPVWIYSDATGAGYVASFTFTNSGGGFCPIPLTGAAEARLKELDRDADELYIYELFAIMAKIPSAAPSAALTKRAARANKAPFFLYSTLTEQVPS